jgi:hypothetical protein
LRDLPLLEVKSFLADRPWVSQRFFLPPFKPGGSYARRLVEQAAAAGARCGYAVVTFERAPFRHTLTAFDTDFGPILVEPQDGSEERVETGQPYPWALEGLDATDQVRALTVYWNDRPRPAWLTCRECGYEEPGAAANHDCPICRSPHTTLMPREPDKSGPELPDTPRSTGTYHAEISRRNPTCFVFLLDQSRSMADAWSTGDTRQSKAIGVADSINRLLTNLALRCAKGEDVLDYFEVAVIGYGGAVGPAWGGRLAGQALHPISMVATNPLRVEQRRRRQPDGTGGFYLENYRAAVWVDPVSDNGTPMCRALNFCQPLLADWVRRHPDAYPPSVLNITDGEVEDGDPSTPAARLTSLKTSDGHVTLFNLQIASDQAQPLLYPSSDTNIATHAARVLYDISSPLPASLLKGARESYPGLENGARGFVLNASLVEVIEYLEIGSRPGGRAH